MQQQKVFMVDQYCLFINVINKEIVVTAEKVKQYVRSSGLKFKSRYTRYKCSFSKNKNVKILF